MSLLALRIGTKGIFDWLNDDVAPFVLISEILSASWQCWAFAESELKTFTRDSAPQCRM